MSTKVKIFNRSNVQVRIPHRDGKDASWIGARTYDYVDPDDVDVNALPVGVSRMDTTSGTPAKTAKTRSAQ